MRDRIEALKDKFAPAGAIAALVLLFFLPFEKTPALDIVFFGTSITLRISTIVAIALLVLTAPSMWFRRHELGKLPYLGLVCFLVIYMLSALLARELGRALFVLGFTVLTVSTSIALSLYVNDTFLTKAKRVLYWSTWIVVVFGYYQYFGDLLGLSTAWTGLRADYTKVVFGFPRIQSTGLEPLYYANFLLIPFFIFAADLLKGSEERKYLLIAIATQVALSVSRGAYAGAVLGLAILLVLGIRAKVKWQQFAGLGAILVLSVVLALFMTTLEFKNEKNAGTSGEKKAEAIVAQATNFDTQDDRDRNRGLAFDAFASSPVFGLGPGGFDKYAREQAPIYTGTPGRIIVNNEPLELLAEGGILAFVVLAGTLLYLYWNATKLVWGNKISQKQWAWLAGLICYLAALAVQYQTFSTLYIMHVWVAIGLLIGLVIALNAKKASVATENHNNKVGK